MELNTTFNLWEVVVTAVILVAWFVRLESKVIQQETSNNEAKARQLSDMVDLKTKFEKEIDDIKEKHQNLESKVVEQLSAVREALARIEGKLEAQKKD